MRRLPAFLLLGFALFIGCSPKIISIVDSANVPFATIEAEPYTILPYKIGVVFDETFTSKIARASDTYRGKEYIFEARLGEDMGQTLPVFLRKNFREVTVLNHLHDAGPGVDYVLVPDISRSKANVVVRMSPVPIYELTVSLKVNVFRNGHPLKYFNIIETKGMEVPRSNKEKEKRQELVQKGYDKLMTRIYTSLGKALRRL
ncbi:MAG: hypothetical protein JRJ39_04630 [Deltaproteobacteria bacterium]|nr:hypothetical protein [Deltaproteobacteria bacterium]MBW2180269.1 hypothetical protein [Deltaproteobacteria bacterium]